MRRARKRQRRKKGRVRRIATKKRKKQKRRKSEKRRKRKRKVHVAMRTMEVSQIVLFARRSAENRERNLTVRNLDTKNRGLNPNTEGLKIIKKRIMTRRQWIGRTKRRNIRKRNTIRIKSETRNIEIKTERGITEIRTGKRTGPGETRIIEKKPRNKR